MPEFDWWLRISWKNALQVLISLLDDLKLLQLSVLHILVLVEIVKNCLSLEVLERSWNEEAFADFSEDFVAFDQFFNRISQFELVNLELLCELRHRDWSCHTPNDPSNLAHFSPGKSVGNYEVSGKDRAFR